MASKSTKPETVCCLCERALPRASTVSVRGVRPAVASFIAEHHPERWRADAWVCRECLNRERLESLVGKLEADRGELSAIESEVARKAVEHLAIAEQVEEEFARTSTPGQRIADRVARVGGSWPFVIGFFACLVGWIALNSLVLAGRPFDPFPYILLNLVLSCVAAVQAPIIMMSQNRMSEYDRRKADQDYKVNLKAELEVASLHDKVDHLLHAQWQHLVEMQEVQIDLLNQIATGKGGRGS